MALEFDGVDQYIDVGMLGNFGSEMATNKPCFAAWIKSSVDDARIPLGGTYNDNANTLLHLVLNENSAEGVSAGRIGVHIRDEDNNRTYGAVNTDTGITDGNLHSLVVNIDGPNDLIEIYVDRVKQTIVYAFQTTADNFANFQYPLLLGSLNNRGTPSLFFEGAMWCRLYNRLFSQTDVDIFHYSQGLDNIINSLVARWLMNEKPDGIAAVVPALNEVDNVDNVASHQGVATDGTYLYTTNFDTIMKRQMDGTLISSHPNAQLDGTDMAQINHVHIYNGKLYIGSNNYDDTPKKGYIKVFDADTLDYIEEHQVLDHYCEGCAFHDNAWWVVWSDWRKVSKYDTSWNHIADYDLTYSVTDGANLIGYQGITWKGNDIYCPVHAGVTPTPKVDRYHRTGNVFNEVARLTPPADATQGICYLASNNRFYIAQRNHPVGGQHSVTITELVGSLITDISGNGNHGTPTNSPVYRAGPVKLVRPLVTMVRIAEHYTEALEENMALLESLPTLARALTPLEESLALLEDLTQYARGLPLEESLALKEEETVDVNALLTESIGLKEAITEWGFTLEESLALSEALTELDRDLTLEEALALLESLPVLSRALTLTESLALLESETAGIGSVLTENLALKEDLTQIGRTLTLEESLALLEELHAFSLLCEIDRDGNIKLSGLVGAGNAYTYVDSDGKVHRGAGYP